MAEKDITLRIIEELGRTAEEQAVISTRLFFAQVYHVYKALKEEVGAEKAVDLYWKAWEGLAILSYNAITNAMGITKITDIPTLGKIIQAAFMAYPALYRIAKETEDESVGHISWCPNPTYGPSDRHTDRLEYYKVEAELTRRFIKKIVELAGMEDWVLGDIDKFMCLRGDNEHCRVYLRKK